jgi:septum formation protein
MAAEKAAAIASREPDALVLAADTVVAAGRRILGKAEDEGAARSSLALLSGRRHRVLSAVTLVAGGTARHRLSTSIVSFKRLSAEELEVYLAGGEWRGKAGGYAIQGAAEALVRQLSGSFSSVMGLPLFETRTLLKTAGYPLD